MKGLFAGIAAGAVGAFLWGLIAMATGFEIGWIAWGIGLAVGAGVAWGTDGGKASGVLAVVISVLAIIGGKFIAMEMVMGRETKTIGADIAERIEIDEEYVISWLADMIVYEREQAGIAVRWPGGTGGEAPQVQADYPPDVWASAVEAWAAMSETEKQEFRQQVRETAMRNVNTMAAMYRNEGFVGSFGVMDVIFFFLAVATAYRVGSKNMPE